MLLSIWMLILCLFTHYSIISLPTSPQQSPLQVTPMAFWGTVGTTSDVQSARAVPYSCALLSTCLQHTPMLPLQTHSSGSPQCPLFPVPAVCHCGVTQGRGSLPDLGPYVRLHVGRIRGCRQRGDVLKSAVIHSSTRPSRHSKALPGFLQH